jgi:hypothetical protein
MQMKRWTMAVLACAACASAWAQTDVPASTPIPSEPKPVEAQPSAESKQPAELPSDSKVPDESKPAPPSDKRWRYVIGVRGSASVSPDGVSSRRLQPEVGLSYGRWRLGFSADQERWVGAERTSSSAIGYSLPIRGNITTDISLRLKNLDGSDSSLNSVERGRRAVILAGRAGVPLGGKWGASLRVTQDISGQGDGTTLTLGVSRLWTLTPKSTVSWGTSLNWGSAQHWRRPFERQRNPPQGWQQIGNGFGSASSGVTYRQSLTKNWAWFTSASVFQFQGDLRRIYGSDVGYSGNVGLLWFGSF